MFRFITSALLALSISGALCAPAETGEQWSSQFAGWHARATPHPDPQEFLQGISPSTLNISSIRNGQADPSAFNFAMFTVSHIGFLQVIGHVVVDARGQVLVPDFKDADGILALAQQTPPLSNNGDVWEIKSLVTDRPTDNVVVPNGNGFTETRVNGFTKETRELQQPVGDITELPHPLWELFGLVLEAQDGSDSGNVDSDVINRVKAVIDQL
ncbi:hypothetical protein BD779DRAFT_1677355 [Infundibulicybe gibba]|nr:hypothetical protein BD779DRAFT_1677355 [Infundibulicybe gibba]